MGRGHWLVPLPSHQSPGSYTNTKRTPAAANLGQAAKINALANPCIHAPGLVPAFNTVSDRKFWLRLNEWQKSHRLQ